MKELRGISREELKKRVYEAKLELSKELGASEIGTVKNPGRIRALRRDIARILTIQREVEKINPKTEGKR
ncbi:MAG: 50S ribosomal protein L29 [Candidatus Aenigmarchaeota archaeon]|nr:50S ribosomal protein L29 [Candidatus Aenigmarchaeota archaeon]